ncbi:MAG: hydrogenase maturation protease [Chloroflexota bacterium]|nr:hydrogenase maturation protease [Chloroflexota bacterium]
MKTLVLGLGNPIVTDDGVGIEVAEGIGEASRDVVVEQTTEAGLALLDYLEGHDRVIIVDSIKTEKGTPGDLYRLGLADLHAATDLSCSHGMDLASAFKIGQDLGCRMPQSVSIYAIEVEDNSTFGEGCTDKLRRRIPFIVTEIVREEKL